MDNDKYFDKMERANYKSKDYDTATDPKGNRIPLHKGQAEHLLNKYDFKSATEARKSGWKFDDK